MKNRKGMKTLVAIMVSMLLVLQCAGPIFAAEEIAEEASVVSEEVIDKEAKEEVKAEVEEAEEEKAEVKEEKVEKTEAKKEVKEETSKESKAVKPEAKAVKNSKSVKEAKEAVNPCTITYVMDEEYFDVYCFNKGPADAKTYTEEKNRITGFGAFYKDRETNKYMFDVTMTLLNDATGTLSGKKVTFPAGTIVSVRSERYDGSFEAKVNYNTEGEGKGFGYTTFDADQNIRILVTPYYTVKYSVNFEAGENGKLEGETTFADINKGSEFKNVVKVPTPVADEGYEFSHWESTLPEDGHRVRSDETYKAVFEVKEVIEPAEPVVPAEPTKPEGPNNDDNNVTTPDDEEIVTPDNGNTQAATTGTVKITTVARNNAAASVGTSAANTGNVQPATVVTPVNNNTTTINDNNTPLANGANQSEGTTINDNQTPLANAEQNEAGSFALVNILLAVLSIISALVIGLKGMRREGKMSMTLVGIIMAIVSIAVFFLTQDLSGNMVIADVFTVVMAVIAGVQLAVGYMMNREEAREENR